MKKMRINPFLWLSAALVITLASCSSKNELLSTIPATSQAVSVVNIEDLMGQLDIKNENGKFTLPSYLQGTSEIGELLNEMGKLNEAVDLKNIALVAPTGLEGKGYLTCLVKDEKSLNEIIEAEGVKKETVEGFSGFSNSNFQILSDGHQLWANIVIYGNYGLQDFATTIKKELDAANKKSISDLSGVKDYLEKDGLVSVAISAKSVGVGEMYGLTKVEDQEDAWVLYSVNIKDNAIVLEGGCQRSDGRVLECPGMQPINNAVLNYIPQGVNFAVAAGLTPKFPWEALTATLGMIDTFAFQAGAATLVPYLKNIDGTIMLSANAVSNEAWNSPTPKNWQILAMVHMPQRNINETIEQVKNIISMSGLSYDSTENGCITVRYEDSEIIIDNLDGYLTLANYKPTTGNQNQLAPVFDGKDGALWIDIPSLQVFDPKLPSWGIRVTGQNDDTKTESKITLQGTDGKILPTLIQSFMTL